MAAANRDRREQIMRGQPEPLLLIARLAEATSARARRLSVSIPTISYSAVTTQMEGTSACPVTTAATRIDRVHVEDYRRNSHEVWEAMAPGWERWQAQLA